MNYFSINNLGSASCDNSLLAGIWRRPLFSKTKTFFSIVIPYYLADLIERSSRRSGDEPRNHMYSMAIEINRWTKEWRGGALVFVEKSS